MIPILFILNTFQRILLSFFYLIHLVQHMEHDLQNGYTCKDYTSSRLDCLS